MSAKLLTFVGLLLCLGACGGSNDGTGEKANESSVAVDSSAPITIDGLPNPCEWLSAEEAQEMLGLDEPPPQTPMGGPDTAGRSCVYTDEEQTAWINVGYEGLNPQVFTAQGKSEAELIELAGSLYAHTLEHIHTGETGGYATLAFQDADRAIMVVFTDIGKARDYLPEGLSDRLPISTYYNVLLHLFAPEQTGETRMAALEGLVDRPVAQLKAVVGD